MVMILSNYFLFGSFILVGDAASTLSLRIFYCVMFDFNMYALEIGILVCFLRSFSILDPLPL